ncbi:hypothetical protein C8F04DRAFT_1283886 [Mycena alexandri]|uniref:Uncharacterized protein n=1 Tax=Mycena alexandri TaxID=1745969 RepID=A0AAD6RVD4_9AGAR|nr:hypothetical protein C8F04DRAFT_1283886 [Mycena alexandri]
MLNILTFAAFIWGTTAASSSITSISDLLAAPGSIVRIADTNGHEWSVDPTYPDVPEFSPVVGVPELSTAAPTLQDWFLVPSDNNTFTIQSVLVPDKFLSYVAIGVPATSAIHSQIVLRGSTNAALFSLQSISNLTSVNIIVPAISKLVTTWTSGLVDPATPVTLADRQVPMSQKQSYAISIIGKSSVEMDGPLSDTPRPTG